MSNIKDHSFDFYQKTLWHALDKGYKITCLADYKPAKRVLLLRHDLEYDVTKASQMAKIEHASKIKATYMVRVHSNSYNPYSFRNYYHLKQILDLGHEIGLHSENLDFARLMNQDVADVMNRDKKILELMLNTKIQGVAGHRDLVGMKNGAYWERTDPKEHGFKYSAWDNKFIAGALLVSDAIGAASEKDQPQTPLYDAISSLHPKIYATIHPDVWSEFDYLVDTERA